MVERRGVDAGRGTDRREMWRGVRVRDECRVGRGEARSFERVIRAWTSAVLSGAEDG